MYVLMLKYHIPHVSPLVPDDYLPQPMNSPGGSSTSSRDGSPSRGDISTLVGAVKPIYICRGHRGYGFTLRAIRVYYGDSDYYTLQHLVVVSLLLCTRILLNSLLHVSLVPVGFTGQYFSVLHGHLVSCGPPMISYSCWFIRNLTQHT